MTDLDEYIFNIIKLRREADSKKEDNVGDLMSKISLLTTCLMYTGKVSSQIDGDYKRHYAYRKHAHAIAFRDATKNKAAEAEIAVYELRKKEADLYQDMNRWRNAMSSTTEELHALKLKLKIDFREG